MKILPKLSAVMLLPVLLVACGKSSGESEIAEVIAWECKMDKLGDKISKNKKEANVTDLIELEKLQNEIEPTTLKIKELSNGMTETEKNIFLTKLVSARENAVKCKSN